MLWAFKMKIFKGITTALILVGFGYSSSVYANYDQSKTMRLISDDQLRDVDAQGDGGGIQNIEQIHQLILNSGLQISHLSHRDVELNTLSQLSQQNKESATQQTDVKEHSSLWMQQVFNNLFANLQTLNPKITIHDTQMLIQLKSIHIERIEVDMNVSGLMSLIDPIGITKTFVTSNIIR